MDGAVEVQCNEGDTGLVNSLEDKDLPLFPPDGERRKVVVELLRRERRQAFLKIFELEMAEVPNGVPVPRPGGRVQGPVKIDDRIACGTRGVCDGDRQVTAPI